MSALRNAALVMLMFFPVVLMPTLTRAGEFQLTPFITLKQEYNDNIFLTEEDEEADFISTVSPGIELQRKTERFDGRLSASVDGIIYADLQELNALDQHYKGSVRYLVGPRVSLSAEAGFTRDSRPDRDIEATGLTLGEIRRDRQHYAAEGRYLFSERTAASLSYGYDREEYEEAFADVQTHSARLSLAHDFGDPIPNTQGRTSLGFVHYEYPDTRVNNLAWSLGVTHRLSEIFSISADAGVRYTWWETRFFAAGGPGRALIQMEETGEQYSGAGQLRIAFQGELTRASLAFKSDIGTSSGRTTPVTRHALLFDVGRKFTRKLSGSMAGGLYWNYAERDDFGAEPIDERTLRINPALRYEFSRKLALEAGYVFTFLLDEEADADITRSLVFLRLVFRYPLFEG